MASRYRPGDPVLNGTGISSEHPTEGLAGYPAHDYFAPSGSTVVAPVGGKVVRLSGHDPRQGPIEGPHGPLGWSVYIQGNDGRTYYLTHMGSRSVQVGQTLKPGQSIGTVADYAHYGTPSHIHMGVGGRGVSAPAGGGAPAPSAQLAQQVMTSTPPQQGPSPVQALIQYLMANNQAMTQNTRSGYVPF